VTIKNKIKKTEREREILKITTTKTIIIIREFIDHLNALDTFFFYEQVTGKVHNVHSILGLKVE
jgi:hypothetical protein